MQIPKINQSLNFTRKRIFNCTVNKDELPNIGVVYELDTRNPKDEKLAYHLPFHKDFLQEAHSAASDYASSGKNKRFYVMLQPFTKETIAYAQTSHHYKSSDKDFEGNTTVIDEYGCDCEYSNAFEPMLAAIAAQAKANLDSSISLAIRQDEIPDGQNIWFSTNELEEQYIDEYRFDEVIEQAELSSQIIY